MPNSDPAESLAERTARLIGEAIMRGDVAPGAALPVEADLARAHGVSRTVVREAVKILAAKGFLRTNRRGGTTVLPMRRWNLLDARVLDWALADGGREAVLAEIAQLRAVVMPEIAASAARHATATAMLRLMESCDVIDRWAADPEHALEAEIAFHRSLFDAAGNRIAGSLLPAFAAFIRARPAANGQDAAYRVVADAVRDRDSAAARRAMAALVAAGDLGTGAAVPRIRVRAGRRELAVAAAT